MEKTKRLLSECFIVKLFWKIIQLLCVNIFKLNYDINQRVLLIGYDIKDDKYVPVNLILNIAQ